MIHCSNRTVSLSSILENYLFNMNENLFNMIERFDEFDMSDRLNDLFDISDRGAVLNFINIDDLLPINDQLSQHKGSDTMDESVQEHIPEAIIESSSEDDDEEIEPQQTIYLKRCNKKICKIGRTTKPSILKKGTQIFKCNNSVLVKAKIRTLFKVNYRLARSYGLDFFEGDYNTMISSIITIIENEM